MEVLKHLTNCKVYSTVTQEEDQNAWLKARTRGIGGSDIGAICGVSNFSSPRTIYMKKTGQMMPDDENANDSQERMHFGHMLEPVVANEYSLRTGQDLITVNATLVHKDYPWALANVDRLIIDDLGHPIGVLECKTTTEYLNSDWAEGELSLSYIYQVQWYLWVTGLQKGAIACLVGGNKFYFYEIFLDMDLINNVLLPTAKHFWFNCVLALTEPEPVAQDNDLFNKMYKEVVKGSETNIEESTYDDLAKTIMDGKAKIKELEATVEAAQAMIKERLKDSEIGYTQNYIIKWSPRSQRRVDPGILKANYPDVYNNVLYTVEFRQMSVKALRGD
jgi:putative phage-type endonuclease